MSTSTALPFSNSLSYIPVEVVSLQVQSGDSLRTANVSPCSSPLRDVSFLLAKRLSKTMSEGKWLLFAG